MPHPKFTENDLARFWSKVCILTPEECWEWNAGRTSAGYGMLTIAGQKLYAHRIAFHLETGIDPVGLLVCHHCDNPPCCNPSHLFSGSQTDNMQDAKRKGRNSPPPDHSEQRRRIAFEMATSIRQRYHAGESMPKLATEVGMTWEAVRSLIDNETYHDPTYQRTRFRDSRQRKKGHHQ